MKRQGGRSLKRSMDGGNEGGGNDESDSKRRRRNEGGGNANDIRQEGRNVNQAAQGGGNARVAFCIQNGEYVIMHL